MADDAPIAPMGDNNPPLDTPAQLAKSLPRTFAELQAEAIALEMDGLALPEAPETEEQAQQLTDWLVAHQRIAKRLDDKRLDVGRPYLDGQRTVNTFVGELTTPLAERATVAKRRLAAYQDAKRERLAAEARAEAKRKREEEEAAAAEAQRLRDEEAAAQKKREEAQLDLIRASTSEERDAAEAQMRDAGQAQQEAASGAAAAETAAAAAGRQAEAAQRATTGGKLAGATKVSAVSGGAAHAKTVRVGRISDAPALVASLGPLGPHFSLVELRDAVDRAAKAGAESVPGVTFTNEADVTVRQPRTPRQTS